MADGAYSIGPSLKIEGEKEFMAQLRAINSEFRQMRAEQEKLQVQFAGQEKSQKSLTAQSKILEKEIEAQNKKLKINQERRARYAKESTESIQKQIEEERKKGQTEEKIAAKQEQLLTEQAKKYAELDTAIIRTETTLARLTEAQKVNAQELAIAQSRWTSLGNQFDTVATKAGTVSKVAGTVGGALTKGVTAPIAAVGAAAMAATSEVNSSFRAIIKQTGATGAEAKSLRQAYEGAAVAIGSSFEDTASAVAAVNQRFNFTGTEAEKAAEQFLKFAKVTGTDVGEAVRLVSRAMGDANIPAQQYSQILDLIMVASQKTGVSVETLTDAITKYGAPLRQIGYDTQQSVAMFAQWEKAGVTTEKAFAGMRIAISKWSKEGKDASKEFEATVKGIQDGTISTAEAMEIFGTRGGPDMIDAIKQGRFNFEEFNKTLSNTTGAVNQTFDATLTNSDKLAMSMNELKIAGAEAGGEIMGTITPALKEIMSTTANVVKQFGKLDKGTQQNIIRLAMLAAGTGPVISGVGKVAGGLSSTAKAASRAAKWMAENTTASAAAGKAFEGLGAAASSAGSATGVLSSAVSLINPVTATAAAGIALLAFGVATYQAEMGRARERMAEFIASNDSLRESANATAESMAGSGQKMRDQIGSIEANAASASNLATTLQKLVAEEGNTEAGHVKIKAIVDQLNQLVPNLNLAYDEQANTLSKNNDEIRRNIDLMLEQARTAAIQQMITDEIKKQTEAQLKLHEIENSLNDIALKRNEIETKRAEAIKNVGSYANSSAAEVGKCDKELAVLDEQERGLIDTRNALNAAQATSAQTVETLSLKYQGLSDAQIAYQQNEAAINQLTAAGVTQAEAFAIALSGVEMKTNLTDRQLQIFKDTLAQSHDPVKAYQAAVAAVGGEMQNTAAKAGPAGNKTGTEYAGALGRTSGDAKNAGASVSGSAAQGLAQNGVNIKNSGWEAGSGFVQNLISGAQAMSDQLESALKGLAGTVNAYFHHSTPDIGPMHGDDTWFVDMIQGWAQDLENGEDTLGAASRSLAATVAANVRPEDIEGPDISAMQMPEGKGEMSADPATEGTAAVTGYTTAVQEQLPMAMLTGQVVAQALTTGMNLETPNIQLTGTTQGTEYATYFNETFPIANLAGITVATAANTGAMSRLPLFTTTGRNAGQNVASGMNSMVPVATASGVAVMQGIITGLESQRQGVVDEASALVQQLKDVFIKGLGIHSPSRFGEYIGEMYAAGIMLGLSNSELGAFAKNQMGEMKEAFKQGRFTADANVNFMDDDSMTEVTWLRTFDNGGVIEGGDARGPRALNNMLALAADNSHGYQLGGRGPDYDCAGSISTSMVAAGLIPPGAWDTTSLAATLLANGWEKVPNDGNPKRGDVVMNEAHHVEWALGNGQLVGFHQDLDGRQGDSSGLEGAIVGYYDYPWDYYLRKIGGFGVASLADTIEDAYKKKKAAAQMAALLASAGSNIIGVIPGNYGDWTRQAAAITGTALSPQDASDLNFIISHESSWNPSAYNPSGASGLGQLMPGTFAGNAVPGHGNIWDPVDNLAAAINYMKRRYGSIHGAWQFWQNAGWYDVGSRYVPYDMPAMVHKGEMIIPKKENPYKNSKGSITGALGGGDAIVEAIERLGDRLERVERSITVNQTFMDANPTPSQIARKAKTAMRQIANSAI